MITIIIPTVKIENLKPCVESIKQYTDLDKVRLLVVANGAKKEMRDYLDSDKRIQYIWFDEMIGYPRAINAGIKARGIPRNLASTDHVILLNDDVILLQQPKNLWIKLLVEQAKTASPCSSA
jgi:GT2 family glycosyltransferase